MRRKIVTALAAAALAAGSGAAWAEPMERRGGPTAGSEAREGRDAGSGTQAMEPSRETGDFGSGDDAAARSAPGGEYVVREGDTLGKLAKRFLGSADAWRDLAEENGIDDPKKLRVGQRLTIPEQGRQGS